MTNLNNKKSGKTRSTPILGKKNGDWVQVTDKQTGLVGWVLDGDFTSQKPEELLGKKNYELIFNEFKERVLEMSKAIESAINVKTFDFFYW